MTPFIDAPVRDPETYQTEYFVTPPEVPVYPPPCPPRRRARPGRLGGNPAAIMAGVLLVVLPALVLLTTLVLHNIRTEPRDHKTLVHREIHDGLLRPAEPVRHTIPVHERSSADYFRATRGELVMTDERLIYVGLLPRDVFAGGRDPDVFERSTLPVDTLTTVREGRAMLGVAPALVIERGDERIRLAVPGEEWPAAEALLATIAERHRAERALAALQLAEQRAAEEEARRPVYHTVARGEALITIAGRYGVTVERLQELNGMTDTRIRLGQELLVKPDER